MIKKAFWVGLGFWGGLMGVGTAAELKVVDEIEMAGIVEAGALLRVLGNTFQFTEGPVWMPGGFLVFSDIPANELKRWDVDGKFSTFRSPSNNANGNLLDLQGRLISCEHGGRRVSIQREDGAQVTVVEQYLGKKLNSPNDVAVKSDGTLWFTDPDYGLGARPKEQAGNYVYRFDPLTQHLSAIALDFDKPNGLCFSPDETRLYVADSGRPQHIRVFHIGKGNQVTGGGVFCKIDVGGPDGIRCDAEGRIFSSAGDGVHIYSPCGALIGKILTPKSPANLCFGGADFKTLFITARSDLYSIEVKVAGAGKRN